MEPLVLPTRDGYDRWAEIYDGEGNPLVELEEPEMDGRLGPVSGLDLLDVGCGTGRHAVRLAGRGARVVAIDFSAGMLARAREKPGAERVRFVEHDLAAPLPFESGSFDRVVCGLVLDHILALLPFLGELGRVCRPPGWVVCSVMHPAMMLKGVQARFVDPTTGRETRPQSAAHQFSDYVMAATRAGLRIGDLSEHVATDELARRVPRAARYIGWPLLFMMVLHPR